MNERLTAKTAPAYRKQLLAEQGGNCALCHEPVSADEAVLDHEHSSGQVRGVLHRGCNAMLGHLENNRPRHRLQAVPRFARFLASVVEYIYRRRVDSPLYPTFRTGEEKRVLRNKRAKVARAAMRKNK
jgi:Recombination endonuclease VII